MPYNELNDLLNRSFHIDDGSKNYIGTNSSFQEKEYTKEDLQRIINIDNADITVLDNGQFTYPIDDQGSFMTVAKRIVTTTLYYGGEVIRIEEMASTKVNCIIVEDNSIEIRSEGSGFNKHEFMYIVNTDNKEMLEALNNDYSDYNVSKNNAYTILMTTPFHPNMRRILEICSKL